MPRPPARLLSLSLALGLSACGSSGKPGLEPVAQPSTPAAPAPARGANPAFARAVDAFLPEHDARHPAEAASNGRHEYDGKLPDVSAAGLADQVTWLGRWRATFEGFAAADLDELQAVEQAAILAQIRGELHELTETRRPFENPMFYLGSLGLDGYVVRDYAPLAERARALAALALAAERHLRDAQANLPPEIARPFLDTALLMVGGSIEFAKVDVARELAGLGDPALRKEVDAALRAYVVALTGYQTFLEASRGRATDRYAIGERNFLRMLAGREGLTIDLARLEALAAADTARNLRAMGEAAAALGLTPEAAAAAVGAERPTVAGLIPLAREQTAATRAFVVAKDLVTIPGDEVAEVRETPSFMRWNSAFLSGSGVFEQKKLPAFYYISPPDPSWPAAEQTAYIPGRSDLLFTTVHEVWPGHFLHDQKSRRVASAALKTMCSYSMTEGWAHYAEEMMFDEGLGERAPKVRVGMLLNALLRDARFSAAIGLHTRGMTVAEAERIFVTRAFADKKTAHQQAVRGTFDPGYLNYTLGKLMIRKLRDDLRAREGSAFSLKRFHDRLLSYGCAPLPAIRRAMLGDDSPAL